MNQCHTCKYSDSFGIPDCSKSREISCLPDRKLWEPLNPTSDSTNITIPLATLEQLVGALAIADNIALVGSAYTPKAIDIGVRKILEAITAGRAALDGAKEWHCPDTGRTCTAEDCDRSCFENKRKPDAYITETEQGEMVWTKEMYGEACMYCDDGEFPEPLFRGRK